jgi:hypothetical protein
MAAPVYFDGTSNELRQTSAARPIDDVTLPSTAVRTSGSTPFVGAQGGVDPVADADLTTKRAVRRFIAELGPWWGQVVSAALTSPPGSPSVDQRWLIAAGAAGLWAGHSGELATWRGAPTNWVFSSPFKGVTVYDQNTGSHLTYSGTAWARSTLHEVLSDLQGGTNGEHYHLTAAQSSALLGAGVAKLFWATPTGASGAPSLRALVLADLPVATGSGQLIVSGVGGVATWEAVGAAAVGAVPTSRIVNAGGGLSGGGALSADITLSWDGLGLHTNAVDRGVFTTLNVVGESATVDHGNGTADLQLPDATLYAMIFGR